jgi:hypothetical protein
MPQTVQSPRLKENHLSKHESTLENKNTTIRIRHEVKPEKSLVQQTKTDKKPKQDVSALSSSLKSSP